MKVSRTIKSEEDGDRWSRRKARRLSRYTYPIWIRQVESRKLDEPAITITSVTFQRSVRVNIPAVQVNGFHLW